MSKPLNKIYSYNWAGLDPSNGDARIFINGKISGSNDSRLALPSDIIYNGRATPSIYGALRNTLKWKFLSLSANISYRLGYYFKKSTFTGSIPYDNTWAHIDYLYAWKKKGDEAITNVPGYLESYPDSRYAVYRNSNILVEKGDHIRLQDIRMDFNMDKTHFPKIPFANISIYAYLDNIGIIWKANKHGIDPSAIGFGSTPEPLAITLGTRVSF